MSGLCATLQMAQEMGAFVGGSSLLLGAMQKIRSLREPR